MTVLNTKSVEDFVATIRNSLEANSRSWIEIGEAFAEARDMFGSDSGSWRNLLKETKFGKSTAHKLASIARSERLDAYRSKLAAVHSWGTLYAIHALSEEQFASLKAEFKLDEPGAIPPFITLSQVERLKKGKTEKTALKLVASISIDENALRGDLMNGDLERLVHVLEDLRKTIPYVRVPLTDVIDKSQNGYFSRLHLEAERARRSALQRGIEGALARNKKRRDQTQSAHEVSQLGMSRDELFALYEADPKAAFDHLGLDYDEPSYQRDAEAAVASWVSGFAKKAAAAGNPFRYSQSEKSGTEKPSPAMNWLKRTGSLQLERVQTAAEQASRDLEDADDDEGMQEAA